MKDDTLLVHAAATKPGEGFLPPVYQAAPFRLAFDARAMDAITNPPDRRYSRSGNPTSTAVVDTVAALEGAEAGFATASGRAALSALLLHHARAGAPFVTQRGLYAGTEEMLAGVLADLGARRTLVEPGDEEGWKRAVRPGCGLVLVETPANPWTSITDLRLVGDLAADAGVPLAVDNTLATPINQRPMKWGATFVVHSATKYLAGHADATGGLVLGSTGPVQEAWATFKVLGPGLAPWEAYLIRRGLATAGLRVRRQNDSALALASWLEAHPAVERVHYPGLASAPRHPVAARQMTGFGGLLSIEVRGGDRAGREVTAATRLFAPATSLGAVHSIITHPSSMSFPGSSPEERAAAGVRDGMLRLAVGIEDLGDLRDDLDQALSAAARSA